MAHGTPDWAQSAGAVTTYQLTDLGELAARLGSIVTFDRRGEVLFLEDFRHGLTLWDVYSSSGGVGVYLATDRTLSSPFSCKLNPGAVATSYAYARTFIALPRLSRVGAEFAFSHSAQTKNIDFDLSAESAAAEYHGVVRLDDANQRLQYLDAAAAYQTFATGIVLNTKETIFNRAKLVIDLTTGKYTRFILNDVEYDLSDYALYPAAALQDGVLQAGIFVYRPVAADSPIHLGNVIATQNEPAQP